MSLCTEEQCVSVEMRSANHLRGMRRWQARPGDTSLWTRFQWSPANVPDWRTVSASFRVADSARVGAR